MNLRDIFLPFNREGQATDCETQVRLCRHPACNLKPDFG